MQSIINHTQPEGDGNAPLLAGRYARFAAAVEEEAARRGVPPESREARGRRCPLCEAVPGVPCQLRPSGDHLARYLDAYTAGQLTREFMAAVLGELVVVASWRIVPDGAA